MLPLNTILCGDSISLLESLPERSINVIFADPPYNLQLGGELYRPNMTKVDAVDDAWDSFDSFAAYDEFTRRWLSACRRVLKEDGTLWVIGSYHNIYRVGAILMDVGFWVLNELVWAKTNPMPNFKGTRFANAHETLIWAQKHKGAKYTFNYHALKAANDDKQMGSVWELPICSGKERLLDEHGTKAHSTQKPEALLYRVLISSTQPGDVVLDPFFGSGTTGAVAKKLRRRWIGIERDPAYVALAQKRIDTIPEPQGEDTLFAPTTKPRLPRIAFLRLLEEGLLQAGDVLRFNQSEHFATITADGSLICGDLRGSIHSVATQLQSAPCNGWQHWYIQRDGAWFVIDNLRQQLLHS